jgi:succinate dehydrogenase/fumarate reductase cytochrome b subunit
MDESAYSQVEGTIIIALHRKRLWNYLRSLLLLYSALGLVTVALVCIATFDFNLFVGFSSGLLEIILVVILLALFFALMNGIWKIFLVIRRLISREPVLSFDEHGITLRDLLGTQMLLWAEIDSLSVRAYRSTSLSTYIEYLGICPKDTERYLLRLHPLLRLLLRQVTRRLGTPISLPQWYLTAPIAEILTQVQQVFSSTLHAYHIEISR